MCLSRPPLCHSNATLLVPHASHTNDPENSAVLTQPLPPKLRYSQPLGAPPRQVSCKFNGKGERKRMMWRKEKGAVALPPPLPSAPSPSTSTAQAARLPAPTPLQILRVNCQVQRQPTQSSVRFGSSDLPNQLCWSQF